MMRTLDGMQLGGLGVQLTTGIVATKVAVPSLASGGRTRAVYVCSNGTNIVYVRLGATGLTMTAYDGPTVPTNGHGIVLRVQGETHLHAIAEAGTDDLAVIPLVI